MLLEVQQLNHDLIGPIDLQLSAGETVCISGGSGSGKSLFLRCLVELEICTGTLQLEGKERQQFAAPEWRKRVALLPATIAWWLPTVGEHFPESRASLTPDFECLGFPPEVTSWQPGRLSSGEMQRLALLRLMQNQPQVMLLDEPTANLDPAMTAVVEKYLAAWQQQHKTGIIWVSHDQQQVARMSDRSYEMVSGQLVQQS